ncbi:MAG: flagellar hook-basal body complex protein FliE [Alphaproteobacteria bacterium]|nr:flagellar hook-basal body complex protein FliE [Alphaproteobacteria bacterium]
MALNAYSNTSNIGKKAGVDGEDGVSFADFLREKASQSIDTMRQSEQMSAKAVTGEADLTDVVQAVGAAELTLQTVIALRDRLVSAYQDIMRLPV